jgi:hypothetical protein
MPEQYATPAEYTDAELLVHARAMIATILVSGTAYTISGRAMTRANLAELRTQVEWLEQRIDASSGPAQNIAAFKRPS